MANLFLYFVCTLAFLSFGGIADDLIAGSQDTHIVFLDISSLDSDSDANDLDSSLSSTTVLFLPSQVAKLDHSNEFSINSSIVQSFRIRAPPRFS